MGGHHFFAKITQLKLRYVICPDVSLIDFDDQRLQGVDCIVHLAARVHVMEDTVEDPLIAFRAVNVDGTRHLLEQAAKAGVDSEGTCEAPI